MSERTKIKALLLRNETYLAVIIIAYCLVVSLVNPRFFSLETLFDILRSGSGTMILATGVLVVLVSGGIDVSFTAVAISGGYIAARLMLSTGIDSLLFAYAVSCGVGLALGAINGIIIYRFRLPTLIATLGTSSVFFGMLTTFVGTHSINAGQMPRSLIHFSSARIFEFVGATGETYGLSVFIIPVLASIVLTWFLLHHTMLGRGIFALGNSRESAVRAGFSVLRLQMFIYMFVGFLAGSMAIVYDADVRWVDPVTLVGSELSIIGSVVIGGAKLSGGEGTILGTVLGVAIVKLLNSTLIFLGLSSSWNNLFVGIILLASVGITSFRGYVNDKKNLIFKL
jgi:simple sugar transport system permease protein